MTSLLGRGGRLLHDLLPRLRVLLHPRLGRLALPLRLRNESGPNGFDSAF